MISPHHDATIGSHNWHKLKMVSRDANEIGCPCITLDTLVTHLSVFSSPGFAIGTATPADTSRSDVIVTAGFTLSREAAALMRDAYAYGLSVAPHLSPCDEAV